MSEKNVSSFLQGKSRTVRRFFIAALVSLTWVLLSGAALLSGQTDPLDVPFRQPQYVLHLSWTITAEWGKVPNDDYMLHPTLPDQNGVILRGAEMGWYQSGAELFAGPFTTPRQVCEAIKGLPLSKIMFIRNVIRCPAPPPPPPPEPKPEPEPEPITRPEPAREPEPEEEEKSPCDREAEHSMLRQAVKQAIDLVIAGKSAMTELAILQKQIERCRLVFPDLIAELILDKEFDPFAKGLFSAAMLSGFQSTHQQLCQKQDAIVAGVISGHQTFMDDLGEKIAQARCPDVKKGLLELKTGLEEEWGLHEVKLYYASGQREKFKSLAKKLLNQNKHTYQINWLLGQDAMQNGEVGQALFAFRDAHKAFIEEMKKHPQNEISEELKQQEAQFEDLIMRLEVAFLKAVDSKVLGDAAYIRSVLLEEIERGESWWNVFTLGVVSSMGGYDWDWFWWVAFSVVVDVPGLPEALRTADSGVESRADSVGVVLSEAAVQHLGLNVIRRFRESGKTLPEIKAADNATIIKWVSEEGKKEGKEKVLSPQRAINLRTWIYHGFRNPDVVRLMSDSREEFERYEGRPYFSPEEFEQTWYERLGDFFLNPLTVASIFAPYAKITSSTGQFLLWPKYMTAAELVGSKNFVQLMSGALRIPELIRKTTAANPAVARSVQSFIKWNSEASLLKRIFVEGMIQTGAVELATAVGGLPGQVVAQVLTTLGVGDLDVAVDILQNAGVTKAAAGQLARSLKEVLEESIELRTQAQIVAFRDKMAKAVSQLDANQPLEDAVKSELRAGAQKLDDMLNALGGKAESDLMRMQMVQLDLTARGLRSLAEGEGDLPLARCLLSVIDDADDTIVRTTRQLQDSVKIAEATNPVTVRPMDDPTLVAGEGKITPTDKACKRFSELWKKHDSRFAAADQALREGNFEAVLNHYKASITKLNADLENVLKSGNRGEAEVVMKDLMLNIESYSVVKDIRHSARHVKDFGSIVDNPLLAEIGEEAAEPIRREINRIFQQAREIAAQAGEKGEEEAQAFLNKSMPLLKSSEGAVTKDLPRLVTVNGERYVLKDYAEDIQKCKSELFGSRLANHGKLKVDTPGCALIAWKNIREDNSFGVIQRFVPDASDLGTVDRGTVLAMRKQVARDRVISMLLGDPDRRSRNFVLDIAGRPYCIDRGESMIIEKFLEYEFIDNGEKIAEGTRQAIVNAMKRKYKMYLTRMQENWPIIEAIDKQITFQDLDEVIRGVESLTEEDFRGLLRGLYDESSEQFNQALETLKARQGALRSLFTEAPSGMGADAAATRRTGILQGLRDRLGAGRPGDGLRPILWNLQPAFVACP